MIYLIDPNEAMLRPPCNPRCRIDCSTNCGIKPLYGIDPVPI